jgi:hypothetical protein
MATKYLCDVCSNDIRANDTSRMQFKVSSGWTRNDVVISDLVFAHDLCRVCTKAILDTIGNFVNRPHTVKEQ